MCMYLISNRVAKNQENFKIEEVKLVAMSGEIDKSVELEISTLLSQQCTFFPQD